MPFVQKTNKSSVYFEQLGCAGSKSQNPSICIFGGMAKSQNPSNGRNPKIPQVGEIPKSLRWAKSQNPSVYVFNGAGSKKISIIIFFPKWLKKSILG